jgi:steroid delta-isomerase-like uncharacterized protein
MAGEGIKAVARRVYEEVLNQGRLELLEEITTEDMVDHAAVEHMGLPPGREGFALHIAAVREAVPDVKVVVDELIADGPYVVVYWTFTGSHAGSLLGVGATGCSLRIPAVSRMRFEEERIAEYHVLPDLSAAWEQMGIDVPATRQRSGTG